jgi:hypothetical protein
LQPVSGHFNKLKLIAVVFVVVEVVLVVLLVKKTVFSPTDDGIVGFINLTTGVVTVVKDFMKSISMDGCG